MNMKHIMIYINKVAAVFASALLFTQCSDRSVSVTDTNEIPEGKVFVTMTACMGMDTKANAIQNGSNMDLTWEPGDKIYVVAPTGGSLGCLTTTGSGNIAQFRGTLDSWTDSQTLHFYYLGQGKSLANGDSEFSYSIATQDGSTAGTNGVKTMLLMHGTSAKALTSTETTFGNITMKNMIAVAKFDFAASLGGTANLTCTNSYNAATLDLATATLTPSTGTITMGNNVPTASAYYLVLIPGFQNMSFSSDSGSKDIYKTVGAGRFYRKNFEGDAIVLADPPVDGLSGLFTVGNGPDAKKGTADDAKVRFSMGNLYCDNRDASNPKFYFEDKQYNYRTIGGKSGAHCLLNEKIEDYSGSSNSGFWGYFAISTVHANSYWGMDVYSSNQEQHKSSFKDWGENPIVNSGNIANQWRTLTKNEMDYLLNTSKVMRRVKYLTLSNGETKISGLIIYPDDYSGTMITDNTELAWNEWTPLDGAGVVFLPLAGDYTSDFTHGINQANESDRIGYYHSSTKYSDGQNYRISFGPAEPTELIYFNCFVKRCVRLVKDVRTAKADDFDLSIW